LVVCRWLVLLILLFAIYFISFHML